MHTYSSSSDSGDRASVFASLQANNTSAIVETVQEGGSDDYVEWPEVNLDPRLSDLNNDADLTYDSGLQELIIDTVDPGRADFALNVGVLGNASGTPLDGVQNVSFGESAVDGGCAINGGEGNEAVALSYNCQDPNDPEVIAALMTRRAVADPRSPPRSGSTNMSQWLNIHPTIHPTHCKPSVRPPPRQRGIWVVLA